MTPGRIPAQRGPPDGDAGERAHQTCGSRRTSARSGSLPDRLRAGRSCLRPDVVFTLKNRILTAGSCWGGPAAWRWPCPGADPRHSTSGRPVHPAPRDSGSVGALGLRAVRLERSLPPSHARCLPATGLQGPWRRPPGCCWGGLEKDMEEKTQEQAVSSFPRAAGPHLLSPG